MLGFREREQKDTYSLRVIKSIGSRLHFFDEVVDLCLTSNALTLYPQSARLYNAYPRIPFGRSKTDS